MRRSPWLFVYVFLVLSLVDYGPVLVLLTIGAGWTLKTAKEVLDRQPRPELLRDRRSEPA